MKRIETPEFEKSPLAFSDFFLELHYLTISHAKETAQKLPKLVFCCLALFPMTYQDLIENWLEPSADGAE